MDRYTRIHAINKVLKEYFEDNPNQGPIPAKEFMELFVEKGIFNQDSKGGLPIRKLLRELDSENRLSDIPYAIGEMKKKNKNWFFAKPQTNIQVRLEPIDDSNSTTHITNETTSKKRVGRMDSDEYYVIELCNEVLGLKASQQHRFDFLVGDSGTKLPVDAYYEDLNLVVEYLESQHTLSTPFFDNKKTVSGVSRGEQRRLYDERRRVELPKHGINLVSISYNDFGTTKRLKRNYNLDIEVVRTKLSDYIKKKKS